MSECSCNYPPGGGTSCDDDQIAICKEVGGRCVGQCIGQENFNSYMRRYKDFRDGKITIKYGQNPDRRRLQIHYINWMLTVTTGRLRNRNTVIRKQDLQFLLNDQESHRPVRFSLPAFSRQIIGSYNKNRLQ